VGLIAGFAGLLRLLSRFEDRDSRGEEDEKGHPQGSGKRHYEHPIVENRDARKPNTPPEKDLAEVVRVP
jgi:hypothetical protein